MNAHQNKIAPAKQKSVFYSRQSTTIWAAHLINAIEKAMNWIEAAHFIPSKEKREWSENEMNIEEKKSSIK